MINRKSPVLALIPARGGSKGVPRKNLALLNNKPLITYTIKAALDAVDVDEVWVSSDDAQILELSRVNGASTLTRPSLISNDEASAVDVVMHFINQLSQDLRKLNPILVYLQPTSPLRSAKHINAALDEMKNKKETCLISVVEMEKSPFKAFRVDKNEKLESLFPEELSNARRQDLPRTFIPNGAMYFFSINDFLERRGFPSNKSLPFFMSAQESVDIDTLDDLVLAEKLLGETHA
jgi:CMP-N,N'-diacetyllegionaminic acid synthase